MTTPNGTKRIAGLAGLVAAIAYLLGMEITEGDVNEWAVAIGGVVSLVTNLIGDKKAKGPIL